MKKYYGFFYLILLTLFGAPTNAKDINLATRTDASGETYFVGFCARPSPSGGILDGLPGHMFVSFSRKYANGKHDFMAIGHTTDAGAAAALTFLSGSVPGYIGEERYTNIHQQCLTVQVDRKDYEYARITRNVQEELSELLDLKITIFEDYSLGSEDCMAFAISVAETLRDNGLAVPERKDTELPMDYVLRLIRGN